MYSPSGAPHERTGPLDAWGLPRDKRTRRHRLALCPLPPSAAPAQARSAVGRPLRGHAASLATRWQTHRGPPWLAVGCGLVRALGGIDAGEAPQRARDGSVGVGECGGTGVHWPPSRPQSPDAGSFQYRPGLCGLGHGRARGGQCVAAPGGPRLGLCRCQHPVVRYHGAGVTYWVSQRTRDLRGWAQRCGRALAQRKTRAVVGVDTALAQVQTILRTVKEHHLFAKGKQAKRQVLTRLLTEVGQLIVQTRLLGQGLGARRDRVTQHALTTHADHARGGQAAHPTDRAVDHHRRSGQGQNPPCGCDAGAGAGAPQGGERGRVWSAVSSELPRGGYVFGTLIRGVVDESKMPLQALAGYREIFGAHATPTLMVYDRGGSATATLRALAREGVKQIGIQPKGNRAWSVAEAVRETVRSERGKTEGTHWHPEDGQIWIQQAHGTSVAHAGDGRAAVYSLLQSEQVHAGSGTGQQVRQKGIGVSRTTKTAFGERHERGKRHPMTLKGVLRHALFKTYGYFVEDFSLR